MNSNTSFEVQEMQGENAIMKTEREARSPMPAMDTGDHAPLFPDNEMEGFRGRWREIQGQFVDEPHRAVEQADQLVSSVITRLSEVFAREREKMEREWPKEGEGSTEELRQALRRYRAFFDRLLAV